MMSSKQMKELKYFKRRCDLFKIFANIKSRQKKYQSAIKLHNTFKHKIGIKRFDTKICQIFGFLQ